MIKLFALLIALCSPAGAAPQDGPAMEQFICDGNFFKALVPADWEKSEEIMIGRQEKQYGVDLSAPGGPPSPASISLLYYAPDHARFKTWEKFISTQRSTKNRVKGEASGQVKDTVVNNRHAKTFDKRSFDMVPPYSPKAVKVEMFERFLVLPAKKGFYVLSFKSAKPDAKRYLGVFESVLRSFKPVQ